MAILGETDAEADPGKVLPTGATGIVATRGPNFAAGYTDEYRNAGTVARDGWLVSGDLGNLDAEGRLFITGRKNDVIIRGAHNIDPQMIEDALLAHPLVETAAAVGLPDACAGELPVAFIATRNNWQPDQGELLAFLEGRIEDPVAMPKRVVRVDTMPLAAIGKIFKPALRAEAVRWAILSVADRIDAPVEIEVGEGLNVRVGTTEAKLSRLKDELPGMPIVFSVDAV